MNIDLNAFAKEVHENAVAHGWWEEDRSFGEIIALCHSELSEALEEYRAGRPMVWYKCDGHVCDLLECEDCETRPERADKPEGIAVELADCIIRILDWCGKEGVDIGGETEFAAKLMGGKLVEKVFGKFIAALHSSLSIAYLFERTRLQSVAGAVAGIYLWAKREGIDIDAIMRLKHEYNKTRPYRHGGKVI